MAERPYTPSSDARRFFQLPPYAQTGFNLYSMANFAPLLEPTLDVLRPRTILEVGSEQGHNSAFLSNYCKARGTKLVVIDPQAEDQQDATVHRGYSQDLLPTMNAEVIFLDGDHNFDTVHFELHCIDGMDQAKVVFMHDVGWPCGFRDTYYEPDRLDNTLPHSFQQGVSVNSETLIDDGLGVGGPFAFAQPPSHAQNGLIAAIDDFLQQRPGWSYCTLPSLYGLGVLWRSDRLAPNQQQQLQTLAEDFDRWRPFLMTLELNRIRLLEYAQEAGNLWHKQHRYIRELEQRVVEYHDLIKSQWESRHEHG